MLKRPGDLTPISKTILSKQDNSAVKPNLIFF